MNICYFGVNIFKGVASIIFGKMVDKKDTVSKAIKGNWRCP